MLPKMLTREAKSWIDGVSTRDAGATLGRMRLRCARDALIAAARYSSRSLASRGGAVAWGGSCSVIRLGVNNDLLRA